MTSFLRPRPALRLARRTLGLLALSLGLSNCNKPSNAAQSKAAGSASAAAPALHREHAMPRELAQDGFQEPLRNAFLLRDARGEREGSPVNGEVLERPKRVGGLARDDHSSYPIGIMRWVDFCQP